MTRSRLAPPLPVADPAAAADALRARGLRVSTARRLLVEVLFAAKTPLTADAIAAGLRGRMPRSDVASVYRNLEILEDVGLVRHVHLGHGPGVYLIARRGALEFLVCESCGAVRSVDPSTLEGVRAAVRAATGWRARFSHFPIVGLCARCARKLSGPRPRSLRPRRRRRS